MRTQIPGIMEQLIINAFHFRDLSVNQIMPSGYLMEIIYHSYPLNVANDMS
jgi:hypothetical protein